MIYYVITLLSQIYCDGPILHAVQRANLFNDSKYFVDMALKIDPVSTLKDFYDMGDKVENRDVLMQFVKDHFHPPGTELVECYPEDWSPFPHNFLKIQDFHLRRWALHLHRIWRDLCRRVREEVGNNQKLYSLLYVPHPFIIPGGRFREFYYWDSYWILKGLLFSEMFDTAKGMIRNLAYMVENHGFVPNGGRVYYLLRSHPPLLTLMAYDYYVATGDTDFLSEVLPMLEKEYTFWLLHRATSYVEDGKVLFDYYQYKASMKMPRPESYREDMELVHGVNTREERERVWSDIASAAETGWDFSTRWFNQSGEGAHNIRSIRTWHIVPVDLNAFMCMNARMLASMYEITGNWSKVLMFQKRFQQAKAEMTRLHWNTTDGVWYDYDLKSEQHVNVYYVSNALPLFARCYDDDDDMPRSVHRYLKKVGALDFKRGLPTSLIMHSAQQWDKENAWPPMVHMVIEGFRYTGMPDMMQLAHDLAENWLRASYRAYIHTHAMFEKYNVSMATSDEQAAGSGGEYEVQTGFGWTNGVILDLLDKYGEVVSLSDGAQVARACSALTLVMSVMAPVLVLGWM